MAPIVVMSFIVGATNSIHFRVKALTLLIPTMQQIKMLHSNFYTTGDQTEYAVDYLGLIENLLLQVLRFSLSV